ncbi:hypothetical protein [Clostridium estertheticum]|nr:hypothetical protein [Clostridium estertheticum]
MLVEKIAPIAKEISEKLNSIFTEEEMSTLNDLLKKLINNIGK